MRIEENIDLTDYNSYKVKSRARKAFFPDTVDEIVDLLKERSDRILIGGGYNIILSKEYYDEDFIILNGNMSSVYIENNLLTAEAGVSMKSLSELALNNSLSGLELFYDIPSTLGGAIVMNAGSKGEDIQYVLRTVTYYSTLDKKVITKNAETMKWGYRFSEFLHDKTKIVLKAEILLKSGDQELIQKKMLENLEARKSKQPKSYPNAGSVFKRPEGYFVGKIMDDLNLKGTSVGGAKISEKHGGFIVNYNNATGKDIVDLIELIQKIVLEKLNVTLEVEQRII